MKAGTPHVCGVSAENDSAPKTISLNDGPHTTHFSVVDAAGNAVASTYTLNNSYGSIVTSTAGFLLNDEMDDFTTQPGVPNALFGLIQSEANAIAPGHRPLSSMTPTILVRDGKLSFVTGSPGGPTIISATLAQRLKLDAPGDGRAGGDQRAALSSPVDAGRDSDGKGLSRSHGVRTERARLPNAAARAHWPGERHRGRSENG